MTWPVFPLPGPLADPALAPPELRPLLRHAQRQAAPSMTGAPKTFGVAADVWRDGGWLWRSYTAESATTCDDWTDEHMGAEAPRNHDEGLWGAPGVVGVADWPIPTLASLALVYGLLAVSDLLHTLAAVVLGRPVTGDIPSEQVLRQRVARAERGYIVLSFEAEGVSVRAMIAPLEAQGADAPEDRPVKCWRARLERREARGDTGTMFLRTGTVVIATLTDEPIHIVVRRAKAALGLTGWPAQRQHGTMTWHTVGAPYRLILEEVNDA